MIAATASPSRSEEGGRHMSPTKAAALLHEQSCLTLLRDQSPRGWGAVTTGGPSASPQHCPPSPGAAAPSGHAAPAGHAAPPLSSPRSSGGGGGPPATLAPALLVELQPDGGEGAAPVLPEAAVALAHGGHHHPHHTGKRAAARSLDSTPSAIATAGIALATKRQVLDHPSDSADPALSTHIQATAEQQQQHHVQQQKQMQELQLQPPAADADMRDADGGPQDDEGPLQSPFSVIPTPARPRQQAQPAAPLPPLPPAALSSLGGTGSFVATSGSGSGAGAMLPPSSSGGGGRRALQHCESSSAARGSPPPAAAAATTAAGTGEQQQQHHHQHWQQAASGGGGAAACAGQDLQATTSEPSLSVDRLVVGRPTISSAGSLAGWLPSSAIAEAVAEAVAESQAAAATAAAAGSGAGGSPRGSSPGGSPLRSAAGGSPPRPGAVAATAAASMLRSGSAVSTAGMGRQNSLVFAAVQAHRPSTTTLESAGSFAGWPGGSAASGGGGGGGGAGGLQPQGSFSWPQVPLRTLSQDSLKLDIQVLPPVIPEEYPPEPDPFAPPDPEQQLLQQQLSLAAQQQHVDRAFFSKVAAWEAELVGMLQRQAAPLAIREIVAVFKDRINTERDKTEFKALCDKWTGVVEFPVGSGVKCLAIKSWMRGAQQQE